MTQSCDVLIVGAGLAGSILTYRLALAGQKVLLVSDPSIPSASRAAAGLINPVTGQRLVLQDNIEALLTSAQHFYHNIEEQFGINILHNREMLRIFRSEKEKAAWELRRTDPNYAPYLDDRLTQPDGFTQHQTGYLNTNLLLDTLHAWFHQQSVLINTPLRYKDISIDSGSVQWQGNKANRLIFCEGWRGQKNPWFDWLPFQPAKGEILTLHSRGDIPSQIINRGKWLLPTTPGTFKLGATYDWNELNEMPTESARELLMEALPELCANNSQAQVIGHIAGVRPGTKDKRPFVGVHSEHAQLGIFNGFGSKGSLLIPWHAEQFRSHLMNGTPLPEQADIRRVRG